MAPGGRRSISHSSSQSESVPNSTAHSTDALSSAASASSRNGRGKAKNKSLSKHIEITRQKPRIEIPVGMMRPVGQWSREFVSEVGIICRTYAPLTCHNWKSVEKPQKKAFHERIKEKFDIDIHVSHVAKAVNTYLGQRFRDYRCRLHQYYKRLEGDEQHKRRHPYEGVSQEHWYSICDRFESKDFQKLSEKNSASRQNLLVNHCAGSKSFIRYREELRDAETQEELGRIELYRRTHFVENKDWTSPIAKQNYEAMIRFQSEPIPEGSDPLTEDEICDRVLGIRPGYIRGLGHGKVPLSSSPSSSCNHPEVAELIRRAEDAEKQNEELNARVLVQDRKIEEMQAWQYVGYGN